MHLDAVGSPASPNGFNVKVSEGQEDQHAKVVGKILEGVENAPKPQGAQGIGQLLNVIA